MNLSPVAIQKFFDSNGAPLVGGKLFTYVSGTSTKQATYTSSTGLSSNTNPVILDYRGECRLWIDPELSYTFVLAPATDTDPPGAPIWTVNDITAAPANSDNAAVDTGSVNNVSLSIPSISSPVAFTRVVFQANHTNTGPMTLQINGGTAHDLVWQNIADLSGGELQENGIYQAIFDGTQWQIQGPTLSPLQMRTAAEIAASVTPTNYNYPEGNVLRYGTNTTPGTTDMTTAIQAAINVADAGAGTAYLPAGTYLTGKIDWPGNNITLQGTASAYSYNTSAETKSILKAKAATTIVLDLVQTGIAEDRTGNLIQDIDIDGNSIAAVGIDVAGSNVIDRVRVKGCTTAGVRLSNFANGTRLVRCGLNSNSGWGLQAEGASTTTFSVTDCNTSLNTLGGINLQAGVLVQFDNVVSESNSGPGLQIYKPNTHTNSFEGLTFNNCWFEDNASTAPNFVLVIDAATSSPTAGPQRVTFNQCRFTASAVSRKYMNVNIAKWVTFENCQFDNSTASDAVTLSSNAHFVSFINSTKSTGSSGITATQIDNAMAQGSYCWWFDDGVQRVVGAGSPAAAFENSWENYAAGFTTAKYWFDKDGNVCIEGAVKTGAAGTTVFTLPAGYRPAAQLGFAVDANGAHGLVYVKTTGVVEVNVGSTTITELNGIAFQRVTA